MSMILKCKGVRLKVVVCLYSVTGARYSYGDSGVRGKIGNLRVLSVCPSASMLINQ